MAVEEKNGNKKQLEQQSKIEAKRLSSGQLWRLVILGTIVLLMSMLFWWSFSSFVGGSFNGVTPLAIVGSIVMQLLLFCSWLALVGIINVASSHYHSAYIAVVPSTITHFIFYGISAYSALVFVLLNMAFFYFARGVQNEANERIHFSVPKSIRAHLGTAVILVLLSISLMFYVQTVVSKTTSNVEPVDVIANSTAGLVSNVIAYQVPEYEPEMPLDEFLFIGLKDVTGSFVPEDVSAGSDFPAVEPAELSREFLAALERGEIDRQQVSQELIAKAEAGQLTTEDVLSGASGDYVQEQVEQVRQELLDSFGVEADGDEPVISVLRKITLKIISDNIGPYEAFIPPFLALALFLVLIIFAWLYNIIIKGLASFYVWLLRIMKVLVYEYRDVKQQLINLAGD
ncbi:hypothetical protein ACFL04_00900 [Patescibacteria group bacterium]